MRTAAIATAVSLWLAGPLGAQSLPLIVNVSGNTPGTAAVIGPGGGVCATPASTQCTFQIPTGSPIRVVANAPSGQQPGRLSGGTGPAAACALSTCGFTMTSAAGVTITFTAGDGPVSSVTLVPAGDGKGSIAADNTRCQNVDAAQPSTCTSAYLWGSTGTLTALAAAGNRFAGYSGGGCGVSPSCALTLAGSFGVTAAFHPFTKLVVSPASVQMELGASQAFTATATYTDGVSEAVLPGPGTWVTRTAMPAPRYGFGVATSEETRVWVVGGVQNGQLSGNVSVIDLGLPAPGWLSQGSLVTPREGSAVVAMQGIWVIGGNGAGSTPLASVEIMIPFPTVSWIETTPLSAPRRYLGAAGFDHTLFAIGGETVVNGVPTVVGTVEASPVGLPLTWTTKTAMPTPRKGLAVVTIGSFAVVLGGTDGAGTPLATVEAYDMASDTWSTLPPLPVPMARPAAAAIETVIYVMDDTGATYQYDTQGVTWTAKSRVPTPRSEMGAASVRGIVYAFGGRAGGTTPSATVEAFTDTIRWGGPYAIGAHLTQQGVATPIVRGLLEARAAIGSFDCTMSGSSCGHIEALDPTRTLGSLDVPANESKISAPFIVGGWAIQRNDATGACIDAIHVHAILQAEPLPNTFLGVATYGLPRSDIAALYGSQYLNSGFRLTTTTVLAPGRYMIIARAHNACLGVFSGGPSGFVTVQPAVSNPSINIDSPTNGQLVTSAFEIGGWAIDRGASIGTGVDAIQFYVFPNDGASSGVFVGSGSYGLTRTDVGAIYGSQFSNSGYHFTITGLGPGNFLLGAYARSTVTGTFSVVKTVHISVNPNQLMSIDTPGPESTISAAVFDVAGWSIDRAVATGTGVDTLHVYAYPNPGSGQPPIFLGVATVGFARSDVAALYGARFTNSGYSLTVNRAAAGLTPGIYSIVVHSHSTSGTFNNLAVVRVTVQ